MEFKAKEFEQGFLWVPVYHKSNRQERLHHRAKVMQSRYEITCARRMQGSAVAIGWAWHPITHNPAIQVTKLERPRVIDSHNICHGFLETSGRGRITHQLSEVVGLLAHAGAINLKEASQWLRATRFYRAGGDILTFVDMPRGTKETDIRTEWIVAHALPSHRSDRAKELQAYVKKKNITLPVDVRDIPRWNEDSFARVLGKTLAAFFKGLK